VHLALKPNPIHIVGWRPEPRQDLRHLAARKARPGRRAALDLIHRHRHNHHSFAAVCLWQLTALATRAYRALLAWRQRWRDSVLSHPLERHTERTLVDPAALARDADATRARGYAADDEAFEDGVRAVVAPVLLVARPPQPSGSPGRASRSRRWPATWSSWPVN
jgi:hypothetical protein